MFVYEGTGMHIYQDDSTAVPEPRSLALLFAGAIGLAPRDDATEESTNLDWCPSRELPGLPPHCS
jgi:hypothetical protein